MELPQPCFCGDHADIVVLGGKGEDRGKAGIEPLMQRMRQLNEWLGIEALVFAPYRPQVKPAA